MIVSLDTETTGLDPWHGSKPFLVTVTLDSGESIVWEWDVDPLTREPKVVREDLLEIKELIDSCERLVLQNSTFDLKMLKTLETEDWSWGEWPWDKIHDTQFSAHMIASCQRRDLTTLALLELGIDVKPFEDAIHAATDKARRITRSKSFVAEQGEWAIAKAGRSDMPSAGEKTWKADMWLPRCLILTAPDYVPDWEEGQDPETHPWATILHNYANGDSECTLLIHEKHEDYLKSRGLWKIYVERLKILRIVYDMKETGVTLNKTRRDELYGEYAQVTEEIRERCVRIANNPELEDLPVNGRSNALNTVIFDQFKLKSPKTTKTGNPSMDKEVLAYWLDQLEAKDKRRYFIDGLLNYRKRKTAMAYIDGYSRFWNHIRDDWYVLHPSLHPTGTNTLRWSSSNPNEQNISKKQGFNLRYCFGPTPGRCWASLDYENVELRIPAYESGEQELIELFERPDDPPYYGSVHLLNFSTVYPDKWKEAVTNGGYEGAANWIKKNWKDSWYQRCKNGDFAVQYGSVERTGSQWSTADRAFGRKGCQALLKARFAKQEALNQHWIKTANDTGYVSTIPDIEIDPDHGYPLECSKTEGGNISPTIPLNYHVQGTACWVIFRAMVKVQEYLDSINKNKPDELKWFMVMQVHDELVIDFPIRRGYEIRLKEIKRIMESCGDYIKVPLKVGCDIHENNWSEGRGLE